MAPQRAPLPPRKKQHVHRLLLFLCVSLALHAALFAAWPRSPRIERTHGDGGLKVALVQRLSAPVKPVAATRADPLSAPAPEPRPKETLPRRTKLPKSTRKSSHDREMPAGGTQPPPAASADGQAAPRTQSADAPATAASPEPDALRTNLLLAARDALAREFRYPMIARRRGWEGEVLLGFRVDPGGRIGEIAIVRSSGHSVLDRSAEAALRRVAYLPATTPPGAEGVRLLLPVIYQLTES